jgi:mannose-6-phosphate isomerase-like protein (cupin superfamily)
MQNLRLEKDVHYAALHSHFSSLWLPPNIRGRGMEVFNRSNSNSTGRLPILTSWMLISPKKSCSKNLSIQISEVPAGSEQPIHNHEPEQCYYIIRGRGLMIIEDESREVFAGDAIFIAPYLNHGIRNIGDNVLEYLTANAPVFSDQYESALWPSPPSNSDARHLGHTQK